MQEGPVEDGDTQMVDEAAPPPLPSLSDVLSSRMPVLVNKADGKKRLQDLLADVAAFRAGKVVDVTTQPVAPFPAPIDPPPGSGTEEISQLKTKIASFSATIAAQARTISRNEVALRNTDRELQIVNAEKEETQKRVKELELKAVGHDRQAAEKTRVLNEAKQEATREKDKRVRVEKELRDAKQRTDDLAARVESLSSNHEEHLTRLRTLLDKEKEAAVVARADADDMRARIAALEDRMDILRGEINARDQELETARERLSEAIAANQILKAKRLPSSVTPVSSGENLEHPLEALATVAMSQPPSRRASGSMWDGPAGALLDELENVRARNRELDKELEYFKARARPAPADHGDRRTEYPPLSASEAEELRLLRVRTVELAQGRDRTQRELDKVTAEALGLRQEKYALKSYVEKAARDAGALGQRERAWNDVLSKANDTLARMAREQRYLDREVYGTTKMLEKLSSRVGQYELQLSALQMPLLDPIPLPVLDSIPSAIEVLRRFHQQRGSDFGPPPPFPDGYEPPRFRPPPLTATQTAPVPNEGGQADQHSSASGTDSAPASARAVPAGFGLGANAPPLHITPALVNGAGASAASASPRIAAQPRPILPNGAQPTGGGAPSGRPLQVNSPPSMAPPRLAKGNQARIHELPQRVHSIGHLKVHESPSATYPPAHGAANGVLLPSSGPAVGSAPARPSGPGAPKRPSGEFRGLDAAKRSRVEEPRAASSAAVVTSASPAAVSSAQDGNASGVSHQYLMPLYGEPSLYFRHGANGR